MSEVSAVKQKTITLNLNGKDRVLKLGMAAMARIEEQFEDIAGMIAAINRKPGTNMPIVILALMKEEGNEDLTKDNIADILDDAYSFDELMEILNTLGPSSLPDAKKEKGNPQAAE